IRTGWLSNPKALAVFRSAQALVDRDAVLYKKMEAGDNRKFRVLVGIESAPHREEPNLPLGTDDADDASGMAAPPDDDDASAAPAAGLDPARQVRTLLGLKPDTGEKLVSLASEHLGLDTAAVKAAMTTRFGPLRRGEKRNPSQYADCWAHLVQAQGHVRTRAAS
ncbi:MAG: hypothetical protein JO086_03590, partial [Acidimicrobiia bacterium]|nr:hypothetical protein [Acidimicrobiia bacterium]